MSVRTDTRVPLRTDIRVPMMDVDTRVPLRTNVPLRTQVSIRQAKSALVDGHEFNEDGHKCL